MTKKRSPARRSNKAARAKSERGAPQRRTPSDVEHGASQHRSPSPSPSEEELQGPPPREATIVRSDRERHAEAELAAYHETSPKLAGGDVDADWQRAQSIGEETPGGP